MSPKNRAAASLARQRWKAIPKEERSSRMAELSKKHWASLSKEERSAEMSRRRKKGKTKKPRPQ